MGKVIARAEPLGYVDVADAMARLKIAVARRADDERQIRRMIDSIDPPPRKSRPSGRSHLRLVRDDD
jgi:hypothetical protein